MSTDAVGWTVGRSRGSARDRCTGRGGCGSSVAWYGNRSGRNTKGGNAGGGEEEGAGNLCALHIVCDGLIVG